MIYARSNIVAKNTIGLEELVVNKEAVVEILHRLLPFAFFYNSLFLFENLDFQFMRLKHAPPSCRQVQDF